MPILNHMGAPLNRSRIMREVSLTSLFVAFCTISMAASSVAAAQIIGQPGHDGPGGVISGVVNTYWPGTASVAANAASITLGSSTGAGTPIAIGDMVLVIQMQYATLNVANSSKYGSGVTGPASGASNWQTAGLYEYVIATSALSTAGGTLSIRGAGTLNRLKNAYTFGAVSGTLGQRTFQVVRVPQFSSGTLSGATALAWDGATGGVLALDVAGTLTVSGTSSLDGIGFRGGGGENYTGPGGGANTDYRAAASVLANGVKGEGVGGTPMYVADAVQNVTNTGVDGYPSGSEDKGAPANAGGGATDGDAAGNTQNAGGGGGGGAGAGGHGGRTWSTALDNGGRGGANDPNYGSTHAILGGGGGAGDANNATGTPGGGASSSGAPGGGIVLIRANAFSGAGSITANGSDANSTVLNDGSGGGGAGGSILLDTHTGTFGGITACANGGIGGSNSGGGVPHGPGGGGGGGYIQLSTTGATTCVLGGTNGTTAAGSPYGVSFSATPGSPGIVSIAAIVATGAVAGYAAVPVLTVTKTTSTPTVTASFNNAVYKITVVAAAGRDTAHTVTLADTLPAGFTFLNPPIPVITLAGGATRPVSTIATSGATTVYAGQFEIPASGSVQVQYTAAVSNLTTPGTKQNAAQAYYLDPARLTPTGTTFAVYNPLSSTGEDVAVTGVPALVLTKTAYADDKVTLLTGASRVLPGGYFQYKVGVNNSGGGSGQSIVITDPLPAAVLYDSSSPDAAGWTLSQAGGTVTGTLSGTLAAGATRFFWVRVKVK